MVMAPEQRVAILFSCPKCHSAKLEAENEHLRCAECRQDFPVINGIPVLINDENSVFAIKDYINADPFDGISHNTRIKQRISPLRKLYRRVAHALSEARVLPSAIPLDAAIADISKHSDERPRVLIIGCGDLRYSLPVDFVYTDVRFSKGLHAIADAHDLPFGDDEFDLVVAMAVLEHVASPQRVVDEIWRVLKPNGHVSAATPFLSPVHMGAYDFTRFTYLGHRRLFRRFADISSGMGLGPGTVLAWATQSLLMSLSGSRNYRRVAKFAALLITFPMKYLDHFARKNPAAIDGAGGLYFYGRKQNEVISDRELIKLYRGGFET